MEEGRVCLFVSRYCFFCCFFEENYVCQVIITEDHLLLTRIVEPKSGFSYMYQILYHNVADHTLMSFTDVFLLFPFLAFLKSQL